MVGEQITGLKRELDRRLNQHKVGKVSHKRLNQNERQMSRPTVLYVLLLKLIVKVFTVLTVSKICHITSCYVKVSNIFLKKTFDTNSIT